MLRIIILLATLSTAAFAQFPSQSPARNLAAEHALLARFEGSWTELLTFKASPEVEPVLINGAVTNKVVLGGRFLEQKSRGMLGEACHEGLSMIGFEPANERFSCVWFDNHDTTFFAIYGKLNPQTQEIVFEGQFPGKNDECTYVYTQSLPRQDKYRWSFKQIMADGTTGWEMSAIGTRMAK